MALVLADRVKETTTTTGTGDISLGGAETNFVAFGTALADSDTTYYAIIDDVNADFEIGIGTYTSGTDTLSRDTILDSTNGGSAVNFGAGVKSIFITYPADKALRVGSDISDLTNDSGFITSATSISTTAPVSPSAGDLWWNSESGQLKIYYTDVDGSQWVDAAAGAADQTLSLGELTGVDLTTPSSGEILQYDGVDWVNATTELNDNTDVDLTSPTSGESLHYDGSDWINKLTDFQVSETATSLTADSWDYVVVTASTQTITLPSSPANGDMVGVSVGNFTDTVVGRNGNTISGLAEDLTIDVANIGVVLVYSSTSTDWRIS
jgi:hypothetical protein